MKTKVKSKALAILMSLAMAFTMIPIMGGLAVYARSTDDPAITIGTEVLKSTSNTSNAQTVYVADKTWRVIGYGGTGVASSADTMTLISSGNIKGEVQFRADNEASDANHYSTSDLKTEVDAVANTFSDGEKAGITTRDLASGDYDGRHTDCIAGDEVKGALLWPLSVKETYEMNAILRTVDPEHPEWRISWWWLRSPGDEADEAALVEGNGDIDYTGFYVNVFFGLRAAFNYNLNSVIFTSAAVGGKSSGDIGADALIYVGTNSDDEWKLTVGDTAHQNFAVDSVKTCNKKILNIEYSGAVTGSNEYVSAIIKDKDGKVKYYGKLKNCTAAGDASGTVEINVDEKLREDDTLYIFNEQCNGDKKTDFSSELKEVAIPQKLHDLAKTEKVEPTCTTPGTEAYWTCSTCGKMFADELAETPIDEPTVIPALGHDWQFDGFDWQRPGEIVHRDGIYATYSCKNNPAHTIREHNSLVITVSRIEPTCEKDGGGVFTAEIDASSSKDGQYHKGEKEVLEPGTATGHTEVIDEAEPATCTKTGLTEGKHCSVCNKIIVKQETVPATGHSWGEWTVTKEATDTEEGEESRKCKRCGETEIRAIPVIDPVVYKNTNGDGTVWIKGSDATADFTFKRSTNDSTTFSHFTGISVDGKSVSTSNYTAEPGSVIVKLKPAYLETLAIGKHTITAHFNDGNSTSADFTIAEKKGSNKPDDKGKSSPKTGDTNSIELWLLLFGISACIVLTGIRRAKR